jgi:hypothetical protein
MSDSDSPEKTNDDTPLTPTQQLKNLLTGFLEGEESKRFRVTAQERAWLEELRTGIDESRIGNAEAKEILKREEQRFLVIAGRATTKKDIERLRQRISKMVEDHEARLDWEAGAEPEWPERTKKKNKPPGSGFVM